MWQGLLGFDVWWGVKFFLAFAVVLALIWGGLHLLKRFAGGALGATPSTRGRQPRLGVIEAAMVDDRRKLWLIRRDNVEHLIMTGGPSDLVIEPSIVRAMPAVPVREPPPARVTLSPADTLPRSAAIPDGGNWPLQPEPPARPQRAAPPPPPVALDAADEDTEEHEADDWGLPEAPAAEPPPPRVEPRLRAEPMLRAVPDSEPIARPERPQLAARAQGPDRLAVLASELSRNFMDAHITSPPPPPLRAAEPRRPQPPPAQPAPPVQQAPDAEENLTEMAQRLESALTRPRPTPEPAAAAAPPPLGAVELPRIDPAARTEPKPQAEPAPVPTPVPAVKPAAKAPLGTLEQEMASLFGHSSGKS